MIAMIHIAKTDLGLDDDTYRDLLERVTGKRSAAELSEGELGRVVDAMRERGFTPKRTGPRSGKPHVRKVWALWGQLGREGRLREPGRASCRAFVKRMTNVEDPEWLTPEQANVVIEAIKAWQRRPADSGFESFRPPKRRPKRRPKPEPES